MKIKDIKRGKWYKTTHGIGVVETVGGTHPPSVQIRITHPFPRGKLFLTPRDFEEETTDPNPPAESPPATT